MHHDCLCVHLCQRMMKPILFTFAVSIFTISAWAQNQGIDSINFYDSLKFEQVVHLNADKQIDFIEYTNRNQPLRKVDYYDSKRRVIRDEIWNKGLIREIEYSYYENGQVIKRYDKINKVFLPTLLNVHIKYPMLAKENLIEGVIKVDLIYDANCIPISYQIVNSLGYGIDEVVNQKMKLMIKLAKKHTVSLIECEESHDYFNIVFNLK